MNGYATAIIWVQIIRGRDEEGEGEDGGEAMISYALKSVSWKNKQILIIF